MKNTLASATGSPESSPAKAKGETAEKLGLALRVPTAEEKAADGEARGLIVESVSEGPAARAGIRSGDVILSANGEAVGGVDQLLRQVDRAGKKVALLIKRGDRTMFVPLTVG
jgi:serine protease Do